MYIPTHYAVAFFFIMMLESGALFLYTVIGLLKSNPLPWTMPPPMPAVPQYPMYQMGDNLAGNCLASTTTVTATTTMVKTIQLPPYQYGIQTMTLGDTSYLSVHKTIFETKTTTVSKDAPTTKDSSSSSVSKTSSSSKPSTSSSTRTSSSSESSHSSSHSSSDPGVTVVTSAKTVISIHHPTVTSVQIVTAH